MYFNTITKCLTYDKYYTTKNYCKIEALKTKNYLNKLNIKNVLKKKYIESSNITANAIIKIIFLKSNIIINVTDTKGTTLIKETSGSGSLFKGTQKVKKMAINLIVRKIKFKLRESKYENFILQLIGNSRNKNKMYKKFVGFIPIICVFSENINPFNGCKYKKIKRKKFKKRLTLK